MREKNAFVSGDYIAHKAGISRTAVWKYVNQLERLGYLIEKAKGRGYKLLGGPDRLYPWEIDRHLTSKYMGRKVVYKETVDSTNQLAFRLALGGELRGLRCSCGISEHGKGQARARLVFS